MFNIEELHSNNNDNHLTHIDNLKAWLYLEYTPKLTLHAIRLWLSALGSAEAIYKANISELVNIAGETAALAFKNPNDVTFNQREQHIKAALNWLYHSDFQGTRHILTWDSVDYPAHLLSIHDPPLLLFVQGNTQTLSQTAVGIVGSRNATQQGIVNARSLAHALAEKNITVISGLALGIDSAAHEGALLATHNSCSTLAVIGTGIDRVYPSSNKQLAHQIAMHGAIVSEFPVGTPPIAYNFPRRNRLIAGLSRGILVVEATLNSGSLITARVAGEQGRDVWAIPGSIHSPLSKGCHQLIKQGAKLVENAHDILEELNISASIVPVSDINNSLLHTMSDSQVLKKQLIKTPLYKQSKQKMPLSKALSNLQSQASALNRINKPIDLPPTNDAILTIMGHEPMDLDQIVSATALSTSEVLSRLTQLELMGDLETLDGGRYQRLIVKQ